MKATDSVYQPWPPDIGARRPEAPAVTQTIALVKEAFTRTDRGPTAPCETITAPSMTN